MFDLLVEFYLDLFYKKPLEAHRNDDGEIQFSDTGDALIDKWEAQLARGESPDLSEVMDGTEAERLAKAREQSGKDPYARSMTMKEMMESVEDHASRKGLTVGHQPSKAKVPEISDDLARKMASSGLFGDDY